MLLLLLFINIKMVRCNALIQHIIVTFYQPFILVDGNDIEL